MNAKLPVDQPYEEDEEALKLMQTRALSRTPKRTTATLTSTDSIQLEPHLRTQSLCLRSTHLWFWTRLPLSATGGYLEKPSSQKHPCAARGKFATSGFGGDSGSYFPAGNDG